MSQEDREDGADIARIAYEASIRALDSQEDQLTGLHTRASFLLGAAGIATGTVLGRTGGSLDRSGILAIIFFAASAIVATWVLLPRREAWVFTSNATTILDASATHGLTETLVLHWLGKVNQANYLKNKAKLDSQYAALSGGCFALAAAIVSAIVSVAG